MTISSDDDEAAGPDPDHYAWWLTSLGTALMWARLRVHPAGSAEVLDCDGITVPYDSEDSARAALLEADFCAFDGLDEEDAAQLGIDLDELEPPRAAEDDEEALRAAMLQPLRSRH